MKHGARVTGIDVVGRQLERLAFHLPLQHPLQQTQGAPLPVRVAQRHERPVAGLRVDSQRGAAQAGRFDQVAHRGAPHNPHAFVRRGVSHFHDDEVVTRKAHPRLRQAQRRVKVGQRIELHLLPVASRFHAGPQLRRQGAGLI